MSENRKPPSPRTGIRVHLAQNATAETLGRGRPFHNQQTCDACRGTDAGKAFLDMLGVFAEFETNLRKERQQEGIAAAKAKGVYKGRPPSIEAAKVRALKAQGLGATEIAKRLGVGRASVYRVLNT